MFMGKHYNSIDAKNRMIIPAKFRDLLGLRCVLTIGFDKCLYIYSMQEWMNTHEKLSVIPMTDEAGRRVIRDVYSNAVDCEIDKQGRIVIPQDLRSYAKIERDLITVGASNKIEVWSKEEWEKPQGEDDPKHPNSEEASKITHYGV
jgi:MraZ protein